MRSLSPPTHLPTLPELEGTGCLRRDEGRAAHDGGGSRGATRDRGARRHASTACLTAADIRRREPRAEQGGRGRAAATFAARRRVRGEARPRAGASSAGAWRGKVGEVEPGASSSSSSSSAAGGAGEAPPTPRRAGLCHRARGRPPWLAVATQASFAAAAASREEGRGSGRRRRRSDAGGGRRGGGGSGGPEQEGERERKGAGRSGAGRGEGARRSSPRRRARMCAMAAAREGRS